MVGDETVAEFLLLGSSGSASARGEGCGERLGRVVDLDRCVESGAGSRELRVADRVPEGLDGPDAFERVFATGNEGRGVFGGPIVGLGEGRGRVVDAMIW